MPVNARLKKKLPIGRAQVYLEGVQDPRGQRTLTKMLKTWLFSFCWEQKNVYQYQSLPFFSKGHTMGEKWPVPMNLPFFAVEAYVGGGPDQAEQFSNNAFRPVPVPKSIFPVLL